MEFKEIKPARFIDAEIEIPGSKSYTNRVLLIAALAEGKTVLENTLSSEDTDVMIEALQKFDAKIERDGNIITVTPSAKMHFDGKLFVAGAGTTMRFLTAFCALGFGNIELYGIERMHQRPIEDLVEALKPLIEGTIEAKNVNEGGERCPPVQIDSKGLKGGETSLKGDTSSQYLSAILMVAPYAENDVEVEIISELTSKPYVDITIDVMNQFGVEVDNREYKRFIVKAGQRYKGRKYRVESDASNMSYFLASAAITGGRVKINKVNPNSVQGDIRFVEVLKKMGCKAVKGKDFFEVSGPKELKAVEVDMNIMPDTVQTLAVLAAVANGATKISNIRNLREKETDRIKAVETELAKVGIKAESAEDSLTIYGGKPHGATINTYNDHRMAMSFAILGLKVPGIKIENPGCVSKSFPDFFERLEKLYGGKQ